jgi:hypothetical protein
MHALAERTTPELDLRKLFWLSRLFRDEEPALTTRVERLMEELSGFALSPLERWSAEDLARARHFAEEIVVLYVSYFYDLSRLPVTYYKREKAIRRLLDREFSALFKEIARRQGAHPEARLVTEEPIYYLLQMARTRGFPKGPKSEHKRPHVPTLKMRFHVDLARQLDSGSGSGAGDGDRRVLLPHEL